MYGTDWLMSSKENGWPDHPFRLKQQLQDLLPLKRFFYQNALYFHWKTKRVDTFKKRYRVITDLSSNC